MQLFGVELWEKSKQEFLEKIGSEMKKEKKVWIATVNPEFMVESWRDKRFLNILQKKTSYNVIDGHGVLWPLAIKNKPIFNLTIFNKLAAFLEVFILGKYGDKLITGVDLMEELCAMAEKEGIPVYFLGGWEPNKVAEYFVNKYPKIEVLGTSTNTNFQFSPDRRGQAIFNKIKKVIVFVALGMKKQEFWIEENWEKLPAGVVMGVGRSFDYYAGSIKRAPAWVRKMGLEWLFSALVDRNRALRQLRNLPVFVWKVLKNNSL